MSVLSKLLHKQDEPAEDVQPEPRCPHTSLVPHWDDPAQMGKVELALYKCEACHEEFSYEQAEQLLHATLPPQEETPVTES